MSVQDSCLASLLEPGCDQWAQPFCTFFPEGLINSSWICRNPEDFLQGSNLLEHKHLKFLAAVSLSHLFCEGRHKREIFCAVCVSSIHRAFKSLLHSSVSFLCSYSVLCSCWGLPLASTHADVGLIWMANHIYFCEVAFVLLLLPSETTSDCTGFLMALWRGRGSIPFDVWALKVSAHSGVKVQVFIQRSLNSHSHSEIQNILTANTAEAGKEKEILKRWEKGILKENLLGWRQ